MICMDTLHIAPDKVLFSASASGAQFDLRPTGVQEVAGSTPNGSAAFFHGD